MLRMSWQASRAPNGAAGNTWQPQLLASGGAPGHQQRPQPQINGAQPVYVSYGQQPQLQQQQQQQQAPSAVQFQPVSQGNWQGNGAGTSGSFASNIPHVQQANAGGGGGVVVGSAPPLGQPAVIFGSQVGGVYAPGVGYQQHGGVTNNSGQYHVAVVSHPQQSGVSSNGAPIQWSTAPVVGQGSSHAFAPQQQQPMQQQLILQQQPATQQFVQQTSRMPQQPGTPQQQQGPPMQQQQQQQRGQGHERGRGGKVRGQGRQPQQQQQQPQQLQRQKPTQQQQVPYALQQAPATPTQPPPHQWNQQGQSNFETRPQFLVGGGRGHGREGAGGGRGGGSAGNGGHPKNGGEYGGGHYGPSFGSPNRSVGIGGHYGPDYGSPGHGGRGGRGGRSERGERGGRGGQKSARGRGDAAGVRGERKRGRGEEPEAMQGKGKGKGNGASTGHKASRREEEGERREAVAPEQSSVTQTAQPRQRASVEPTSTTPPSLDSLVPSESTSPPPRFSASDDFDFFSEDDEPYPSPGLTVAQAFDNVDPESNLGEAIEIAAVAMYATKRAPPSTPPSARASKSNRHSTTQRSRVTSSPMPGVAQATLVAPASPLSRSVEITSATSKGAAKQTPVQVEYLRALSTPIAPVSAMTAPSLHNPHESKTYESDEYPEEEEEDLEETYLAMDPPRTSCERVAVGVRLAAPCEDAEASLAGHLPVPAHVPAAGTVETMTALESKGSMRITLPLPGASPHLTLGVSKQHAPAVSDVESTPVKRKKKKKKKKKTPAATNKQAHSSSISAPALPLASALKAASTAAAAARAKAIELQRAAAQAQLEADEATRQEEAQLRAAEEAMKAIQATSVAHGSAPKRRSRRRIPSLVIDSAEDSVDPSAPPEPAEAMEVEAVKQRVALNEDVNVRDEPPRMQQPGQHPRRSVLSESPKTRFDVSSSSEDDRPSPMPAGPRSSTGSARRGSVDEEYECDSPPIGRYDVSSSEHANSPCSERLRDGHAGADETLPEETEYDVSVNGRYDVSSSESSGSDADDDGDELEATEARAESAVSHGSMVSCTSSVSRISPRARLDESSSSDSAESGDSRVGSPNAGSMERAETHSGAVGGGGNSDSPLPRYNVSSSSGNESGGSVLDKHPKLARRLKKGRRRRMSFEAAARNLSGFGDGSRGSGDVLDSASDLDSPWEGTVSESIFEPDSSEVEEVFTFKKKACTQSAMLLVVPSRANFEWGSVDLVDPLKAHESLLKRLAGNGSPLPGSCSYPTV